MSFAQRAWTADIIANGFNQDWEDLARQKNLPPYNAFLSDALANTRKNLAPRISPITSVGDLPGTINTPTYTLSGTTITLTFTFASEDDTWGIWTHVDDHSIYRPAPTNVIGFADVLSTKIGQPLTTVIAKLAHGSINWLQFTVFSFDGTSQLAATILGPILVP